MDRPRRALLEEPDNVESYVAKRSLGFTQADSGDRIVVRPARAARPLEPSAVGTQPPTAGRDLSDPPMPRRATPAEPLSWDFDDEKPTTTEPAAVGRRAIVDLEPTPSRQPVVPSQPAAPLAVRQAAPENPQPPPSAPSPPREPAIEPPKITAPPATSPAERSSRPRSLRPRHLASQRSSRPRSLRVGFHPQPRYSHRPNRSYRLRLPFHRPPGRSSRNRTGQLRPPIVQQRRYPGRQRCLDQRPKPGASSRFRHPRRTGRRRPPDHGLDKPSIALLHPPYTGPGLPPGPSTMRCRQSSSIG